MNHSEVWLINFSPSLGDEIAKIRPAIIVSNERIRALALKTVVPLTTNNNPQEWHVSINPSSKNGLRKKSVADCNQIKSVSKQRFVKKLGSLSETEMDQVKWTLAKVLDLV